MIETIESIPHCEIFYPTLQEFQNFSQYVEKATKIAKSGIFKVVPPKGWKARKDNYKNLDFVIPHPIEQIVTGRDGFYEVILLQRESRLLSKYQKYVDSYHKITENKSPGEIEKLFWKTLKFSSPLYGADAPGSIFDKGVAWNLSEIASLLKIGLDKDIVGVTTPYLYIGSWKAMFAWHKEDLDLCSINYLHFGKQKCWYGIPQDEHKKFEDFAAKHYPEAFKECSQFLRHKTYFINPIILKENGLTVNKCIQNPGEFVITKCAGYHAGFNMGFNCAEAVNFALKDWVQYGLNAKFCKCLNDSVKIDMKKFVENIKQFQTQEKKETKNSNLVNPFNTKLKTNEDLENHEKLFTSRKTKRPGRSSNSVNKKKLKKLVVKNTSSRVNHKNRSILRKFSHIPQFSKDRLNCKLITKVVIEDCLRNKIAKKNKLKKPKIAKSIIRNKRMKQSIVI